MFIVKPTTVTAVKIGSLTIDETIKLRDALNEHFNDEKVIVTALINSILASDKVHHVRITDEAGGDCKNCYDTLHVHAFMEKYFVTFWIDVLGDNNRPYGWLRLIPGNETSIISDYSTRIEHLVKPANDLADKLEKSK